MSETMPSGYNAVRIRNHSWKVKRLSYPNVEGGESILFFDEYTTRDLSSLNLDGPNGIWEIQKAGDVSGDIPVLNSEADWRNGFRFEIRDYFTTYKWPAVQKNPNSGFVLWEVYFFFLSSEFQPDDPRGLKYYIVGPEDYQNSANQVNDAQIQQVRPFDEKVISIEITNNKDGGLVIGDIIIDPKPETSIHFATLNPAGLSPAQLPVSLARQVVGGEFPGLELKANEKVEIETKPMPMVSDLEKIKNGTIHGVKVEVSGGDLKTTFRCFYHVEEVAGRPGDPAFTFCYFVDENPAQITKLGAVHKDDLNFYVLEVGFGLATQETDGYVGFKITGITKVTSPHNAQNEGVGIDYVEEILPEPDPQGGNTQSEDSAEQNQTIPEDSKSWFEKLIDKIVAFFKNLFR
ncbi:MAG: hypothetical protein H6581_10910 [Bacteroidia bacterium]|nr:hypothetical protein [Bacteroidia bacterium]